MLGPVFHAEMLTTARRRRYYVLRAAYASVLLALIASAYSTRYALSQAGVDVVSIRWMTDFAQGLFRSLAIAQVIGVLFLVPALVGGVVAEEKHRRTLHYLLGSHLWSVEIVLGKLAARLLHVAMFVAVGLPVVSLLSLFGGIDPGQVLLVFGGTASTAFFLAALAILASTVSRRPRGAIILAYALTFLWLALPPVLAGLAWIFPETLGWFEPVASGVYPGFMLILNGLAMTRFATTSGVVDFAIWMAELQLIYGVLFVAVAAWRLRPIARTEEGRPRWEMRLDKKGRRRWQLRHRPPIGRDAMLWKERYTARFGGLARLALLFLALAGTVFIFCFVYENLPRAWHDMMVSSHRDGRPGRGQSEFHDLISGVTGLLFAVWLLGTAVTAASGVSGERDGDTWISLVSTTLTGWEILRAKAVGAIVRFRYVGYLLAVLWGLGLVTRSLHPIGVVGGMLEMACYLAFAAALGTWCSLRARTSTRSLVQTVGILVAINGGYLVCCLPAGSRLDELARLTCMPVVVSYSLLGYAEVNTWLNLGNVPVNQFWSVYGYGYRAPWDSWITSHYGLVLSTLPVYALAAAGLLLSAVVQFDRWVDRPRLPALAGAGLGPASAGQENAGDFEPRRAPTGAD